LKFIDFLKDEIKKCIDNFYTPIIVGPTASGKTELSYKLADIFEIEIISADSRQVYKYLDIGTAKPAKQILDKIPHHLISIISPTEKYSAFEFANTSQKLIIEIFRRNKLPLIIGGTGLYIKTLFDGIFEAPAIDEELRKDLSEKSNLELFEFLKTNDPETAEKIHINDKKRLLRAVEVIKQTGKKFSIIKKEYTKPLTNYKPRYFYLNIPREELYAKINARADLMLKNGWIDETQQLLQMGYTADIPAFEGLGYREIIKFLNGELKFDVMREQIKMFTRRYAKRQIIWFNYQIKDAILLWGHSKVRL